MWRFVAVLAVLLLGYANGVSESFTATIEDSSDNSTETFSYTEEVSATTLGTETDGAGLSAGAIVGIVLGVVVFAAGTCLWVYIASGSFAFTDRIARNRKYRVKVSKKTAKE